VAISYLEIIQVIASYTVTTDATELEYFVLLFLEWLRKLRVYKHASVRQHVIPNVRARGNT